MESCCRIHCRGELRLLCCAFLRRAKEDADGDENRQADTRNEIEVAPQTFCSMVEKILHYSYCVFRTLYVGEEWSQRLKSHLERVAFVGHFSSECHDDSDLADNGSSVEGAKSWVDSI